MTTTFIAILVLLLAATAAAAQPLPVPNVGSGPSGLSREQWILPARRRSNGNRDPEGWQLAGRVARLRMPVGLV